MNIACNAFYCLHIHMNWYDLENGTVHNVDEMKLIAYSS